MRSTLAVHICISSTWRIGRIVVPNESRWLTAWLTREVKGSGTSFLETGCESRSRNKLKSMLRNFRGISRQLCWNMSCYLVLISLNSPLSCTQYTVVALLYLFTGQERFFTFGQWMTCYWCDPLNCAKRLPSAPSHSWGYFIPLARAAKWHVRVYLLSGTFHSQTARQRLQWLVRV